MGIRKLATLIFRSVNQSNLAEDPSSINAPIRMVELQGSTVLCGARCILQHGEEASQQFCICTSYCRLIFLRERILRLSQSGCCLRCDFVLSHYIHHHQYLQGLGTHSMANSSPSWNTSLLIYNLRAFDGVLKLKKLLYTSKLFTQFGSTNPFEQSANANRRIEAELCSDQPIANSSIPMQGLGASIVKSGAPHICHRGKTDKHTLGLNSI
ncbi:hypothetical protein EJ08DRAFT_529155 [Tothia fuscella]|uniref:Uncharacterized protein n=1 Tax=Tothia fuscella TaxID=1048955 RepID=A0A9P4TTM5_9PEZI|nr:hypothetical protein EJ08DRAFT_529155 [Tothia fuscella]